MYFQWSNSAISVRFNRFSVPFNRLLNHCYFFDMLAVLRKIHIWNKILWKTMILKILKWHDEENGFHHGVLWRTTSG